MDTSLNKRTAIPIFLIALLATAGGIYGGTKIEAEVDFVDTVPDHAGLQPYRNLLDSLEGVRFVAIYQSHNANHGDSLRGESFDALVEEQGRFFDAINREFPGKISHTLSAWEGVRTGNYMLAKLATAGNPPASSYSIPSDPVRYELVKQQILGDDTLDDVLARDGTSAISLFFLEENNRELALAMDAFAKEWAAREPHPATQEHQASGLLYSSAYTDETNRHETLQWGIISAVGVLVSLLLVLRRPTNVLISIVSLTMAFAWTVGLMGLLQIKLSFLTLFLAPVIVGIGIDYAVHLLHRYEEFAETLPKGEALRETIRTTGRAVFVASATTVAGLATLALVPAPLFSEIGAISALGVLLGGVAALTVTPAMRRLMPHAKPRPRRAVIGPMVAKTARSARKWGVPAAIVLTLGFGVAATQVTIESGSSENEFPQNDPVIQLQARVEEEYGAFQRAYYVFEGDLTDPHTLQVMHEVVNTSANLPLYREASAITTILVADADTDQGAVDIAINGLLGGMGQEPSDAEKLPQTREEAMGRLDALFEDPLWSSVAPFTISRDYQLGVVAITVAPWQNQGELRDLRDAMVQQANRIQETLPEGTTVAAAGAPMNRAAIIDQTPYDVAIATIGAAFAVFLVLGISWSKHGAEGWKYAAVGGGLVLLAAIWLLGSVPILDALYDFGNAGNRAPLTDMFLLAFAITVAVGVDDFVHVVSRFWESGSQQDAWSHAGRAISGTTFTTVVAFGIMSGVYFLQSKNLAILTALGVLYAYMLTLFVVPRLLPKDANPAN